MMIDLESSCRKRYLVFLMLLLHVFCELLFLLLLITDFSSKFNFRSEFLARCDMDPLFITKLGRDMQGEIVQNEMKNLNMVRLKNMNSFFEKRYQGMASGSSKQQKL